MQALQVVQDAGIQDFTQLGASDTDRGGTYETADQGTGNTAQCGTCGASDDSNRHTESPTGQGSADAGEATCDSANGTSGFAAEISRGDVGRTTVGT